MTQTQIHTGLLRKQFLVTPENMHKVHRLAQTQQVSATEIVRQAIEAYSPIEGRAVKESDLMALAQQRLLESIADVRAAHKSVKRALKMLPEVN